MIFGGVIYKENETIIITKTIINYRAESIEEDIIELFFVNYLNEKPSPVGSKIQG